MKRLEFIRRTLLPVSVDEAFRYHQRPGAIERMIPPWEFVDIRRHDGIYDEAVVELVNHLGPVPLRWTMQHRDYDPPRQFRDVQLSGPFAEWNHLHRFESAGDDDCELVDHIRYRLPAGAVGSFLGASTVASKLDQMFSYRHQVLAADLLAHAKYRERGTMKIAIAGASGLVGRALVPLLTTGGHDVHQLVRREQAEEDEIAWLPTDGTLHAADLEGFDAVIHLGGESIAEGRWTTAKKRRIRESRVASTKLLAETIAQLEQPPQVFVCASAIGYYGDRGNEPLTESCKVGNGFLPEVCQAWEAACEPAANKGVRVAKVRFGMILSPRGGALGKMLTPFKLAAGGRIGDGRQTWSWVSLEDAVRAVHHAVMDESVAGPINVTAPQPVTNLEFTKALGRVLRRPTIAPMPAFAARLAFGEMADALMLCSARVFPEALQTSGFEFRDAEIEAALRNMLGKAKL